MSTSSNNQSSGAVNPAFRKILFGYKVARFALWLAGAGVIAGSVLMLVLGAQGEKPFGMLFGLLFLLVLIPLYPLSRLLRTKLYEPALRCAKVMDTVSPRSMQLKYLGAGDLSGQYVALWPAGQPESGPVWGFASVVSTTRRGIFASESEPVAAYIARKPDDAVVFVADKSLYWGRLLDASAMDAGWRQTKRFLFAVVALMLAIFCAIGIETGLNVVKKRTELRLATASVDWPRVQGVIMLSGAEPTRIPRNKGSVPGFEARVLYTYDVRGTPYQGERLRFGGQPDTERETVARAIAPYPPGTKVDVAFDPADPAQSVLEPGHVEDCARQLSIAWQGMLVPLGLAVVASTGIGFFLGRQFRKSRRLVESLLTRSPSRSVAGRPG